MQARRARLTERARRIDGFGNGGVRGNLRVQQLAQPDDRERAHFRLELLTGTREQPLEQRIEPQVPANAVVGRAHGSGRAPGASLATSSRAARVERTAAQRHVRNDPAPQRARTAAERLTIRSTAPSSRCALRNSAADIALRPAICTRVSRSTPLPVATSMPAALVAAVTVPGSARADHRWASPPTRAVADRSTASRAIGHGLNARTCRSISAAERDQSIALPPCESSSRRSRPRPAARAAARVPCARSRRAPRAAPARRAQRGDRAEPPRFRAHRIGSLRASSSIGPVSRPASICMIVTPLSRSPARSRAGSAQRRASAAAAMREC